MLYYWSNVHNNFCRECRRAWKKRGRGKFRERMNIQIRGLFARELFARKIQELQQRMWAKLQPHVLALGFNESSSWLLLASLIIYCQVQVLEVCIRDESMNCYLLVIAKFILIWSTRWIISFDFIKFSCKRSDNAKVIKIDVTSKFLPSVIINQFIAEFFFKHFSGV